jgi:hypothetical protein
MKNKNKNDMQTFYHKIFIHFLMSGLGCSGGVGHMESDPK